MIDFNSIDQIHQELIGLFDLAHAINSMRGKVTYDRLSMRLAKQFDDAVSAAQYRSKKSSPISQAIWREAGRNTIKRIMIARKCLPILKYVDPQQYLTTISFRAQELADQAMRD